MARPRLDFNLNDSDGEASDSADIGVCLNRVRHVTCSIMDYLLRV